MEEKPKWLKYATSKLGVKEYPGSADNPDIVEFHQTTTLKATDDEVSWCSSFVNWSFKKAGIKGTNSAAAKSWLDWGEPLMLPQVGAVAIWDRGGWKGHVGIVDQVTDDYEGFWTIEGNVQDGVRYRYHDINEPKLMGFRWPKGV